MRRSLALIAAVALAAVLGLVADPAPAAAAPGGWLARINGYRASNGLAPLTEDVTLNQVAQTWTQTMASTNTLAHNPNLAKQVTLVWTRLAENVGYGYDEASIFQAFVNSAGHRANLLGGYNGVGIGEVVVGGKIWTTHVFVATTSALTPPPPPPPPPPPSCPAPTGGTSTSTAASPSDKPTYVPLTPSRLMDTRPGTTTIDGISAGTGALAPCTTRTLQVAGRAGIPAAGVGAVALNVTATGSTTGGFLTAFPSGTSRPLASNLNFGPGETIPNLVIAKVSADGRVSIYNDTGSTHVIADVAGWLPAGAGYSAVSPARLLDTRPGQTTIDSVGAGGGAVAAGATRNLQVTGRGGVPASGVGSVVLNVTAIGPTAAGFLTVFPAGDARPLASNLNFAVGQTIPNLVVAEVGAGGQISIFNATGSTHVIADVAGWLPTGSDYSPVTAARLLDTRTGTATIDGLAAGGGAVAPGATRTFQVTGRGGVPASGVAAVVLNLTATGPTTGGYLTVFPAGEAKPLASNLNFTAGQTIPNLVIAKVGAGGQVSIFNATGSTHVIADVAGWLA